MAEVGSITFTQRGERKSGGLKCLIAAWTSHATSGAVSGIDSPFIRGKIEKVVTDPSATAQPDDNYDLTLPDEHGFDLLQGLGANRDETNNEVVYPAIQTTDGSNTGMDRVAVCGKVQPTIASAGNSKQGTVYIYYKEE